MEHLGLAGLFRDSCENPPRMPVFASPTRPSRQADDSRWECKHPILPIAPLPAYLALLKPCILKNFERGENKGQRSSSVFFVAPYQFSTTAEKARIDLGHKPAVEADRQANAQANLRRLRALIACYAEFAPQGKTATRLPQRGN
jgi:hypothetical protein